MISLLTGLVKRKAYPLSEPMLVMLSVMLNPRGFKVLALAGCGELRVLLYGRLVGSE